MQSFGSDHASEGLAEGLINILISWKLLLTKHSELQEGSDERGWQGEQRPSQNVPFCCHSSLQTPPRMETRSPIITAAKLRDSSSALLRSPNYSGITLDNNNCQ